MRSRMSRAILAFLAIICAFFWTAGASAQSPQDCTADGGEITCPVYRYELLRDKARVGSLLCQALKVGSLDVALPSRLHAVCTNASVTSRIWAQSQTWQKHKEAADKLQQRVNVLEGRLSEVRSQAKQVPPLRQKLGAAQEKLGAWYRNPWVWAGIALVAGGGGYVVGSVMR